MALMQEVLNVHHTTLRSLLDKFNAYESATEGDSFIIAFHSAADAVAYAAAVQIALLIAPWPQELLGSYEEAAVQEVVIMWVLLTVTKRSAGVPLSICLLNLDAVGLVGLYVLQIALCRLSYLLLI